MKHYDMNQLKQQYEELPIPEELDIVVRNALKQKAENETPAIALPKKKKYKGLKITAVGTAAAFAVLVTGANLSPAFAASAGNLPVVGSIVRVLTFREDTVDESTYHASIKTPSVQGLESNQALQYSLNQKYLEENKKLYEDFQKEMAELEKSGGGHLGVESGYEVRCDDDSILSIGRYVVQTVASSSTTMQYDTIDKKNQMLITLPSLFKDNTYIEVISQNIQRQMKEQNKANPEKVYWVKGIEGDGMEQFERIAANQNFYINSEHKLVISFDKYEVAPGYMGIVEFIIPTNEISSLLVGHAYIR